MKSILLSSLALGAMTAVAMAGPAPLTGPQLDGITAGKRVESETTYLGNSNNECTTNCDVPGRRTETSSRNPGNPDNTNCNNCGDTSSGPGNK